MIIYFSVHEPLLSLCVSACGSVICKVFMFSNGQLHLELSQLLGKKSPFCIFSFLKNIFN